MWLGLIMTLGKQTNGSKDREEADQKLYLLVMRVLFQIFLLSRLRGEEPQERSNWESGPVGEATPSKYLM